MARARVRGAAAKPRVKVTNVQKTWKTRHMVLKKGSYRPTVDTPAYIVMKALYPEQTLTFDEVQ
ncbi:hypothetical protein KIPB_012328, partial [Kipferlia bialata]|eukprot:g12328.t1